MKNGNFKCQTCDKAFKMKHHLKAHLSRKFPCIPNYSILFQKKQQKNAENYQDLRSNIDLKKKNQKWNKNKKKQEKKISQIKQGSGFKQVLKNEKNFAKNNEENDFEAKKTEILVLESNEDSYQCEICNRKYKYKYNLKKHQKKKCNKKKKEKKKKRKIF